MVDEFLFRELAVEGKSTANECCRDDQYIALAEKTLISFSLENHQVGA